MIDRKLNITKASKYRYIVRIKNKHIGVFGSLTEACIERDRQRAMMDFNVRDYHPIDGFSERLNKALYECGMDLTEVSKKSGVTRSLIWAYRFQGVIPNSYRLARLAVTLNVSTDWLLGIKGEE